MLADLDLYGAKDGGCSVCGATPESIEAEFADAGAKLLELIQRGEPEVPSGLD
jgi:hypothetical protein